MRIALLITIIAINAMLALPARAASDSPIASKDGVTYTVEDLDLYLHNRVGIDGLRDFFRMITVYQEGINQGLKPTKAEIDDFIDKNYGSEAYEQFKQLYSENAIRRLVEHTIVIDKYHKWLSDKIRNEQHITVTEKEAQQVFWDNIKVFHQPQGVKISIISVDTKEAADAALKRLQAGENFNDIAAEVNTDPRMRENRGYFGLHRRGATLLDNIALPDGLTEQEFIAMLKPDVLTQMTSPELPKALEDAAFALKAGQYSGVIKVEFFNIVFCHEQVPEVSPTFEDVKESLIMDLVDEKIGPYYDQAINDLMRRESPRFKILADMLKPEADTTPAAKPKLANPKPPAGSGNGGSIGPPPSGGK